MLLGLHDFLFLTAGRVRCLQRTRKYLLNGGGVPRNEVNENVKCK